MVEIQNYKAHYDVTSLQLIIHKHVAKTDGGIPPAGGLRLTGNGLRTGLPNQVYFRSARLNGIMQWKTIRSSKPPHLAKLHNTKHNEENVKTVNKYNVNIVCVLFVII